MSHYDEQRDEYNKELYEQKRLRRVALYERLVPALKVFSETLNDARHHIEGDGHAHIRQKVKELELLVKEYMS